jgi:hypothetical protein
MSLEESKKRIGDELTEISKIISGEVSLRKREEKITKLKEDAVKKHNAENRRRVVQKEMVLEDSDIPTKKVVQNIKLFEWEAPDRYDISFNTKTFWIISSFSLVFILFLAILGHYWLMFAIVSLLFFVYVAGTNKPQRVKHKITARGIDTGDRLYEWFMLDSFWFSIKNGQYFLIVETKLRYPKGLILLLDNADKDAIFVLLQEKVLYKDVRKQGTISRLTYGNYIPFEQI